MISVPLARSRLHFAGYASLRGSIAVSPNRWDSSSSLLVSCSALSTLLSDGMKYLACSTPHGFVNMAHFAVRPLRVVLLLILATQLAVARDLLCASRFGSGINPSDCTMILQEFLIRHAVLATDGSIALHRVSHNLESNAPHTFSRHPAVSKARWRTLPQCLSWQTCAIGFDASTPSHTFTATWLDLVKTMESLKKHCVVGRGVGGVLSNKHYNIVVTNPSEVLAEGTCLAAPKRLPMSLGHWIEAGASPRAVDQSHSRPSTSAGGDLGLGMNGHGKDSRSNSLPPHLDLHTLSLARSGGVTSAAGSSEQRAEWDQTYSPPSRLRIGHNNQRLHRTNSNGHSPPWRMASNIDLGLYPILEPTEADADEEAAGIS